MHIRVLGAIQLRREAVYKSGVVTGSFAGVQNRRRGAELLAEVRLRIFQLRFWDILVLVSYSPPE